MSACLVGVIGHVDHGKSALVRALTGVDTDRLAEEKRRGVSIVLGFALLETPAGTIDLVDVPGHERFVRAMVAGATGMEAVLLVVAANEGVKPQTIEHLEISRLIGIRRGVVALTKCDLVSAEEARRRSEEARRALRGAGLEAAPVVLTSATSGRGLNELVCRLADLVRQTQPKPDHGLLYLPVDRAFIRPGFGPVVTGTLRRGPIAVGNEVEVYPAGRRARVRSLQIHGRAVTRAEPGRRVAVSLRGLGPEDLQRGCSLGTPGMLVASRWIDAALEVAASAPRPLANGARLRLLYGTTDVGVRLRLLDRAEARPGEATVCQFRCETDIAVPAQEPFILRLDSPAATVGGGRILDPSSRRRRRDHTDVVAGLSEIALGQPRRTILARLQEAGPAGAAVEHLARLVGFAPERVRPILGEVGARPGGGDRVVDSRAWDTLENRVRDVLCGYHRDHPLEHGMARAQLLAAMPAATGREIGEAVLDELAASGLIVHDRGLFRRADFDPSCQGQDGTRQIEDLFRLARLAPPDEAEVLAKNPRQREGLRFLLRQGVLVRVLDRVQGRAVIFHRDAIEEAKRAIAGRLRDDQGFLAREAGALLGISRKYSIPLLEHLDAVRFTRRLGDRRIVIGEGAADSDARSGPEPPAPP